MITIAVMGVLLVGCGIGMVAIWRQRSSHAPTETGLEHQPPAVSNPTFTLGSPGVSYEAAQTLNLDDQPTLPERMYNRDYAEINPDQVSRGTGNYVSL